MPVCNIYTLPFLLGLWRIVRARLRASLGWAFIGVIFGAPYVSAQSPPGIADIARILNTDSFWSNRPISVHFIEQAEWSGSDTKSASAKIVYECQGLLLRNGFKGLKLLDNAATTSTNQILPAKKVFVVSNEFNMSYFLYSTNTHFIDYSKKGSKIQGVKANAGEATIGISECKCDEKFWPFALTPSVLAQKLDSLKNVICSQTNIGGDSLLLVVGEATDEPPGIIWNIFLKRTSVTWLPVVSEVSHGSKPISEIRATFDLNAGHFSVKTIENKVFRDGKVIGILSWHDITTELGGNGGNQFSGIETIPEEVIVDDYRFKKPIAYLMGGRPPTKEELIKMADSKDAVRRYQEEARTDTPLGVMNLQSARNAKRPFVRIILLATALMAIPLLWLGLKSSRRNS